MTGTDSRSVIRLFVRSFVVWSMTRTRADTVNILRAALFL